MSHDDDRPCTTKRSPANRLELDYRAVPPHRTTSRIVDIHTHVHDCTTTDLFFKAAHLHGVNKIVSMTPLDEVDTLRERYPGQLEFVAIPNWRCMDNSGTFQRQWLADLETFRGKDARTMKFWAAPPLRGEHGLTLEHPFFQPLIRQGLALEYDFMVHVADPTAWFEPGGRYADARKYGTKREQYAQLVYLLETVAPRTVIAAHMGGSIEEPEFVQTLLDRFPHLLLDSSATKWIVRGVARQPAVLREFVIHNQDRILFGSDLVIADRYDFDHYASRYRAHQMMWETAYRGESPIEDPDGDNPPRLAGLDLPADVLRKLYAGNAERLGYREPRSERQGS